METVLNLRRDYDLVETISRETVKCPYNDCKYLTVVFRQEDGGFAWFYQDREDPYCDHDIATGFDTAEDARADLMETLGATLGVTETQD